MAGRRAFISYSTPDREFARVLDATLRVAGVETLRDEHGIAVGDSIPEWIYDSIARATDLIYVISGTSLNSSWVEEELSVAKMRQKRDSGFGILPVLVDEVELPTSMAHVRFADFRQWQDPASFREASLTLLLALGIEPRFIGNDEVAWWMAHREQLASLQTSLTVALGVLDVAVGLAHWFETLRWAVKDLHETDVPESLERVRRLAGSFDGDGTRVRLLGETARDVAASIQQAGGGEEMKPTHDALRHAYNRLGSLVEMFAGLQAEALRVVTATIGYAGAEARAAEET